MVILVYSCFATILFIMYYSERSIRQKASESSSSMKECKYGDEYERLLSSSYFLEPIGEIQKILTIVAFVWKLLL